MSATVWKEGSVEHRRENNENKQPANYEVLAQTLKSYFASCTSKRHYLSSAPQCPFPDLSNPTSMMLVCDFVFVQFYSNPGCEIGSAGFEDNIKGWSETLLESSMEVMPILYIGAPAFREAGPIVYTLGIRTPKGMESVVRRVRALKLPNLGGVSFWDGPQGRLNKEDGKTIIDYAKKGFNYFGPRTLVEEIGDKVILTSKIMMLQKLDMSN
ncbi:glycoside hydrolase superfamily [Bisporella sp. PMI_857]|nr:glycoside hydrolase superfamily [Bisporella sp. PMI_857]